MKKKNNLIIILGIILLFIGTLLPSIRIAQENISFLKENGIITIILVLMMYTLYKLEKQSLITVPSTISLAIITKFIISNINRLNQINKMYNCYAKFQYGLVIMILANIIILATIIKQNIHLNPLKEKLIEKINKIKEKKQEKEKKITPSLIEKLIKKQDKKTITTETTKDGKIKYNKIIVKVNNKEKNTFKQKINNMILKLKVRRVSRKKLSISKYKEENTYKRTYYIPSINIRRWTRNNICCINCGATINENSEYCFLCDCKIKLNEKEEKLS